MNFARQILGFDQGRLVRCGNGLRAGQGRNNLEQAGESRQRGNELGQPNAEAVAEKSMAVQSSLRKRGYTLH